MGFTFYDATQESGPEKQLGINRVLAIRRRQLRFLAGLYGADNVAVIKAQGGLHLHSDDDWRKFLLAKFTAISKHTNKGEALTQVVELFQHYLCGVHYSHSVQPRRLQC